MADMIQYIAHVRGYGVKISLLILILAVLWRLSNFPDQEIR